jgi:hypothetical protein
MVGNQHHAAGCGYSLLVRTLTYELDAESFKPEPRHIGWLQAAGQLAVNLADTLNAKQLRPDRRQVPSNEFE